jgi:hypothetical protein
MYMSVTPKQFNKDTARGFLSVLHSQGLLYHCDDPAEDIIDSDGKAVFTANQAVYLNRLMSQFYMAGIDMCEIALELLNESKGAES